MENAAALQVEDNIFLRCGCNVGQLADASGELLLGGFEVEDELFGRGKTVTGDGQPQSGAVSLHLNRLAPYAYLDGRNLDPAIRR